MKIKYLKHCLASVFFVLAMNFAREVSTEVILLHKGVIEERNSAAAFFSHPQSERLRAFLGRSSDGVSVLRFA